MLTFLLWLATVLSLADTACAESSVVFHDGRAVMEVVMNRAARWSQPPLFVLHTRYQFAHACPPSRWRARHIRMAWRALRRKPRALPAWWRSNIVMFCAGRVRHKWADKPYLEVGSIDLGIDRHYYFQF